MARTNEEILDLFHSRRRSHERRMVQMEEVRKAYEGELDLPFPELDRNERPLVANLVAQGVDQTANRIVSTMPNVTCPPLRPGFDTHEKNAEDRRQALYGFWSQNRLNLIQRRRARWLITFASAPVMILPDPKRRIPMWDARSPLTALPPPGDDLAPLDMIFTFKKSLGWLRKVYPESAQRLGLGPLTKASPDTQLMVVQYADYEVFTQLVLGVSNDETSANWSGEGQRSGPPFIELDRIPNKAGICPAVYPTRIGLATPQGQFDGVIGLYWNQAQLMALEAIAVKRAIFADEWLVGRPGETPQVIVEADGMTGVRGEVSGATIQQMNQQPGVMTYPTLDRIERAIRLSAGIPSELTGEAATNVRTARRGAQILSSAIDFAVQECQEIFEAALEEENVRAIAIDKAYFGKETKAFYFSWNGTAGRGEYVPEDLWVSDENRVKFSYPGADINALVVSTGQRLGMEIMSHHRAMEIDPMIEDPDLERDRITAESLERAFMQGLQTQVSQGQIPPDDAAYIVQQVVAKRVPLFEAVMRAQSRAQARQASQPSAGAAEDPTALPPGSPEAQMGLAAGPEGAAAAAIPESSPSMENLQALLSQRRSALNAMR